jgi:hypothetical protein
MMLLSRCFRIGGGELMKRYDICIIKKWRLNNIQSPFFLVVCVLFFRDITGEGIEVIDYHLSFIFS